MTRDEVFAKVRDNLATTQVRDPATITEDTSLDHDLSMDSLDTVEFCMRLTDDLNVLIEPKDISPRTVRRVVDLVVERVNTNQ